MSTVGTESFPKPITKELRVGVFGEELETVAANPETISIMGIKGATERRMPVLAPIGSLEWFNFDLMKRIYGSNNEDVMVYLHPEVSTLEESEKAKQAISKVLDSGGVIIGDLYADDNNSPLRSIIKDAKDNPDYEITRFGTLEQPSAAYFYNGEVKFAGVKKVSKAEPISETYSRLISYGIEGMEKPNPDNGPDLMAVIDGQEADEIWRLYKKPFEELGVNDPIFAGFDEETLKEILKDPNTTKIVNRVNGKISTLLMFVDDFNKVPWFDPVKYKEKYPEYFDTNNILIFPGIVTDKEMRGMNYAQSTIDFALKLYAARGSNAIITFECTQISSTYIPELVAGVINNSGIATIEGVEEPVGSIEYFGIRKKSVKK